MRYNDYKHSFEVTDYQMWAANGRPIRKATQVTFKPSGQVVQFTERLSKRAAIEQAREQCAHPAKRLWSWTANDGTFCIACCDCGAPLRGQAVESPQRHWQFYGHGDFCVE